MQIIQTTSLLLSIIITITGFLIPFNVLSNRSALARTFFTDEQKLKVKYFNTILFSLFLALGIPYFYIAFKLKFSIDFILNSKSVGEAVGMGIFIFVFFIMTTTKIFKSIDIFFIKYHYKFKFEFASETYYIIGMLDKETSICSTDKNYAFSSALQELTLIPLEDIKRGKLIEEKITKPNRKISQKLMELF